MLEGDVVQTLGCEATVPLAAAILMVGLAALGDKGGIGVKKVIPLRLDTLGFGTINDHEDIRMENCNLTWP
jgi:hypothetical protein